MTLTDPSLFDVMIAEREGLLRRAARIAGSPAVAEDVLQQLWLKVEQTENPAGIRHPRAYLFRLIANLAIDHQRSETTRARIQAQADAYLWGTSEAVGAEQALIDRETLSRVIGAISTLPEPTRTIFRLNRFDHVRIADIATMQGLSTTTIENHLRRALAVLRRARDPA